MPGTYKGPPTFPLVRGPGYASLAQEVVGEFLATTLFLTLANGAAIAAGRLSNDSADATQLLSGLLIIALGSAFATYGVTVVFASFGVLTAFNWSISLAHFAFYAIVDPMQRNMRQVLRTFLHMVAQYLGALTAVLLLWTFYARDELAVAAPRLSNGTTKGEGFMSEMVLSTIVYFLFIFSGVAQLRSRPSRLSPLVINDRALLFAFLSASAVFTGGRSSGTYLNANRFLAIATVTGSAPSAGVFVGGPLAAVPITLLLLLFAFWLFSTPKNE
jgi:hypothetical protein